MLALVLAFAGFAPIENDGGIAVANADGASFADLDGDGDLDFLTVHPEVFLGNGDGTFAPGPSCGMDGAPIVADFDNDGALDVLRIRDAPILCRGDGAGGLVLDEDAVEPGPFVGVHHLGQQIAYGGAAADFDGDGWLDFYMSDFEDHLAPEQPNTFLPFPDLFYANDGTGKLAVAGQAPRGAIFQNRGVTIGDYDDDRSPDVYSASYRLNRDLLWNIDDGEAVEVGEMLGCLGYGHTISASFADFDGDLDLDVFVCNFAHPGNPESLLCRNHVAERGVFVEDGELGIPWEESYASVAAGDYDADGDLDLFITTVYPGDEGKLFQNAGDGTFVDATVEAGLAGQHEGYGVAWGDVDGDGDRDLYLGGLQTQHLFRNELDDGAHWLVVAPRGDGVVVDTLAVGTRVIVRGDGLAIAREVQAGGSGGDRGMSEHALHFGLGDATGPLEVEVSWRSGETCVYQAEPDTMLRPIYDPSDPACGGEQGGSSSDGGDATTTGDVDASTSSTGDASSTSTTTSTAESSESTAPADDEDVDGCGCTASPRAPWLAFVLVLARRRRSRHEVRAAARLS
jgi:hypothetical protein